MATNSQLSTIEAKKKNKRSKELEHEQNHKNEDHMEDYQWEGGGEEWGGSTRNKKHKW